MKRRLVLLILILSLVLSLCNVTSAFGATANVSISGGGTYNKGDTVRITYTYSGATFGIAATDIRYDYSVLQYTGCSGGTGPTSASGVVSVMTGDGSQRSSLTVTLTFKALKPGSSSVTVSTGGGGVVDYDGKDLSVANKSATVTVKDASPTVSGNANLSSLKVSAGTLSPSFSPSVTSYTVNVGEDVKVCTMSATPQDSKAKISVSGNKNLSMGKNVRSVTVTAQNGSTKTYKVTINRGSSGSTGSTDDPSEETPNDNPEETPTDIIVTVEDKDYVVQESYDENTIPKGFIMTVTQYGDKEIPVIKDESLKYTFALLKDQSTGDEKWFFYDEETDTFKSYAQISVEDAIEYVQLLAKLNGEDGGVISKNDKILLLTLGGTAVALAGIILILQISIVRNKRKDEFE